MCVNQRTESRPLDSDDDQTPPRTKLNSYEKKVIVDSEMKDDGIEINLANPSDDMLITTSTNKLTETKTSVSISVGEDKGQREHLEIVQPTEYYDPPKKSRKQVVNLKTD